MVLSIELVIVHIALTGDILIILNHFPIPIAGQLFSLGNVQGLFSLVSCSDIVQHLSYKVRRYQQAALIWHTRVSKVMLPSAAPRNPPPSTPALDLPLLVLQLLLPFLSRKADLRQHTQPPIPECRPRPFTFLALVEADCLILTHDKPHVPHPILQELQAHLCLLHQGIAAPQQLLRSLPISSVVAEQVLRLVKAKADLAEDVHQIWQLLVVRNVQGQVDDVAHVADDPFAVASGERQSVVAAADGVVDGGVVKGKGGNRRHNIDELAAAEDGVLTASAADAGAGEGRVDVIVAVVEAREGILDWSCDLQWAGAELALLVVHGFVGAAFGVVLCVCKVVSCL